MQTPDHPLPLRILGLGVLIGLSGALAISINVLLTKALTHLFYGSKPPRGYARITSLVSLPRPYGGDPSSPPPYRHEPFRAGVWGGRDRPGSVGEPLYRHIPTAVTVVFPGFLMDRIFHIS